MGKYQVFDLKKVAKQEAINLKKISGTIKRAAKTAITDPTRRLNLKPFSRGERAFGTGSRSPYLDSIRPPAATPNPSFHLIPRERKNNLKAGRFIPVLRVAASGLLIVLAINLLNVFATGMRFKTMVVSSASSGLNNFLEGINQSKNLNPTQARTEFLQARGNFNLALDRISFLKTSNTFGADRNVASLEHLLQAGQEISSAGELFAKSAEHLQNWPALFIQANQDLALGQDSPALEVSDQAMAPAEASHPSSLTDQLKADLDNIDAAIAKLSLANQELNQVEGIALPATYRNSLPEIRASLANLEGFLTGLSSHFPAILELLGDRYPHRYLILLQNDSESRPTGGFIGSLLIVDVNDGVITKADFHDVYQFDGQLLEAITPPEDIARITKEWHLRDSNYSPDFALSAEKAAWFLQKSKGPSVDTVIAINQSAISDLLATLGPLSIPELKADIDANNFQLVLSYLVETKYYGADNPKIILSKVIEAFKQKVLAMEDPEALLTALIGEIRQQKILFYSRDADIQQLFDDLRLTPHQARMGDREDYLQVIATSIGGNKSDLYMSQALHHSTLIDSQGTLHDELTISRTHNWDLEELARWQTILKKFGFENIPENFQKILGRSTNISSIKVYVPLGAELENAVGIDPTTVLIRHDAELEKTYFLFPMSVAPSTTQTVILRYKLPYALTLFPADIYRLTVEKQLTLVPTTLQKDLRPSPPLTIEKSTLPTEDKPWKLTENWSTRAVIVN